MIGFRSKPSRSAECCLAMERIGTTGGAENAIRASPAPGGGSLLASPPDDGCGGTAPLAPPHWRSAFAFPNRLAR